MDKPMLILIAGPYRSGTGDDPALLERNLQRLESAVARLESAATDAGPIAPFAKKAAEAERKLADLGENHAALKEAATRIASRLDMAIGRLSGALDQAAD